MTRRFYPPHSRGFTLLELLVVLGIIGLLIGVTAVSVSGNRGSGQLKLHTEQAIAFLRNSRNVAVASGRVQEVSLVSEELGSGLTRRPDTASIQLPEDFVLSLSLFSPASEALETAEALLFYPDGTSSGGTLKLEQGERASIVKIQWLTGEVTLAQR